MHAVIGASGHVGSAVLTHLLEAGEQVLAVTHSPDKKTDLERQGAKVVVVDIRNTSTFADKLSEVDSVFVLMPPGDVTKDSVKEELNSVSSLIKAIQLCHPKKIVIESTQGAQIGEMIGDLGVLFELEEGIRKLNIPTSVTRAGFYMSNWDVQLENAKKGKIQSLFPADFKMPMAAPEDLGRFNATKLLENNNTKFEIIDFSGPQLYSAADVANAFSKALGHPVSVEVIPQNKWEESFKALGFSEVSAKSYAEMSRIAFEQRYENQGKAVAGTISIDEYIENLVRKTSEK